MLRLLPSLFAAAVMAAGSLHAQADLVVNEIHYAPDTGDLEFVEVYNRSRRSIDLRDVSLGDSRSGPVQLTDQSYLLAPETFAVLARSRDALLAAFPSAGNILTPQPWPTLNNSGDAVILYGIDALVIDSVHYESAWGKDGMSLERVDPDGPSDASNFAPASAARGGTPGRVNSVFAPDTDPPQLIFAEVDGNTDVLLYFSEALNASRLPEATFQLDDREHQHVQLNASGDRLRITFDTRPDGRSITATDVFDRAGNRLMHTRIALAQRPAPHTVVINEVLYAPRADDFDALPNQPEYVELYNTSGQLLSLSGAFLTGRRDEQGRTDTLFFAAPAVGIESHGFAVVSAQPDAVDDPASESLLARSFPDAEFGRSDVVLFLVQRASLNLSNQGDAVVLHRADGAILDSVTYDPSWHHPGIGAERGVALERVSPAAPTHQPDNWTSSPDPWGGTPGRANAVAAGQDDERTGGLTLAPTAFSPDGDGQQDHVAIHYSLLQDVSVIRVRIFDQQGRLVRSLEEGRPAGRTGELIWDGRDDRGRPLHLGIYAVHLEAVNASSGTSEAYLAPVVVARQLD